MEHSNENCIRCSGSGFDPMTNWPEKAIDNVLYYDEAPRCDDCKGTGKNMKKTITSFIASVMMLLAFGCSNDTQVPVRQQPKALLCHVRGVPNACYIFTPKEIEYSLHDFGVIYFLTDDDGQTSMVFGMDCMIMPREAIGDGACTE